MKNYYFKSKSFPFPPRRRMSEKAYRAFPDTRAEKIKAQKKCCERERAEHVHKEATGEYCPRFTCNRFMSPCQQHVLCCSVPR